MIQIDDDRILDPNIAEKDLDVYDKALRPQKLDDFVGQAKAKENLKIFISAAKQRNEALDHTIMYGPPGLGKTTIAQIISVEMGVGFKSTSGPLLSKSGDLAAILTNLQPKDVLFIDEIHRLNPIVEEILYPAMEDYKLDLVIGEGPAARTIRIDLPPFTLVGATTRLGLISNPLRDRFGIPTPLQFYNVEELKLVIERAANILEITMEESGGVEIAKRSRGTPRIALRLLRRVRDFALLENNGIIDKKLADNALIRLEVDAMGLDQADRKYLNFIALKYDGGPVGIETVAAGLSEKRDSIEEIIEPFLIQQGFIQRTSRGRLLTEIAFNHIGVKRPKKFQHLQISLLEIEDA